jgi:geranylgeranyl pyrophosphate synthase
MDDQSLRRGRPTCHVQFDEALAILAGDALLTLAFELITARVSEPTVAVALVRELATATGRQGMIAGQAADIEGESRPADRRLVDYIHERKTGRLIQSCCRMGVIAAGTPSDRLADISEYGRNLGRAFQIADDLLDATATVEQTGKHVRQDGAAGKQTYPASVGIEESRRAARAAADEAVAALAGFGDDADTLRDLVRFVVERVG